MKRDRLYSEIIDDAGPVRNKGHFGAPERKKAMAEQLCSRPLAGIRVIDLTAYGAGPMAGKVLGNWGADVIKVEPLAGDPSRTSGVALGLPATEGANPHMEQKDSNKRSIALDLKTPEGAEVMDRLIASANIFISNFRLKALKKLGLDYETLSAKYPSLIWGHLSGFGTEGPDADNPGFDTVSYWAKSGMLIDFCEEGYAPLTPPFGLGDTLIGASLAGGVAACLHQQKMTGKGEKVVTSLYGMGMFSEAWVLQSVYRGAQYPRSRKYPDSPMRNTYRTRDNVWIFVSVLLYDKFFPVFCRLIGHEELIGDSRFNSEEKIMKDKEAAREFVEMADRAFAEKTWEEWHQILLANGIAHDKINHMSEALLDNPQTVANNNAYLYTNRDGSEDLIVADPIRFGGFYKIPFRNAPLCGEQTSEILQECGYDQEQIGRMIEQGVVRQHC